MRTVWKYELDENTLVLQNVDPKIIHVGNDPAGNPIYPTVWVELETDYGPEDPISTLYVIYIGTGHQVPGIGYQHVGSTVTPSGLVWHVYSYLEEQ